MISRRAVTLSVPGALLSLCAPLAVQAAASRELFTLGRSSNANVVKYAVRAGKDGRLLTSNPVEAYWLMLAENGRREELTWTERQLAYGFSVSAVTAQGCTLHLAACADRELRIRAANGAYHAELAIARTPAILQSVFVQLDSGALLPSVRHVEVSGVTATGTRISERILPRRVSRF
jgi:hypothetical protein